GQHYSAGLAGLHILVLPPALNALVAGHSGHRHHAGGLRQRRRNGGGVSPPAATATTKTGRAVRLFAAEPTAAATAAAVPATAHYCQHLWRRRSARQRPFIFAALTSNPTFNPTALRRIGTGRSAVQPVLRLRYATAPTTAASRRAAAV